MLVLLYMSVLLYYSTTLHIFSKYASDSALASIAAPLNGRKKRSRRLEPPGGPGRTQVPGTRGCKGKSPRRDGTRGCIDAAAASLRRCSPSSVEQCSWESLHNEWERRVCSDSSSSFFSASLSLFLILVYPCTQELILGLQKGERGSI